MARNRLHALIPPAVAAALLGGATLPAFAQAPTAYKYEFTPYIWGAGLDGETSVGGLPAAHVERKFSDLLENLDFGLMGTFEARNGRLGLLVDGLYFKLTNSMTSPGALARTVNGKVTQQVYSAAVTYRVNEGDAAALDVLGGVRYTDLRVRLELVDGLFGGTSREESKGWLDAILGARAIVPLSPTWALVAYGDVGVGGSDSTWQALIGANYALSQSSTLKFGYRFLAIDYDKDQFRYDMDTKGLYVGVGFKF